jgi:hypothetical protein
MTDAVDGVGPVAWCIACGQEHRVFPLDVVRTFERHDEREHKFYSRYGQVDLVSPLRVRMQVWNKVLSSAELAHPAGTCRSMGPEHTTFEARFDQIACIVLHATEVDTSLDIPTAMCLTASACIDELIEGKLGHVFLYVDGSVRHPKNPTPAATATGTATVTGKAIE